MKSFRNQFVSAFVIFSSILQAPLLAQAQVIEDLPNLEAGESLPQTDFLSSIEIKGVSQKANGTLYVVDLKKALSLSRLDLKVAKSRIRLYSVILVTDNSTRVPVQNFSETDIARGATVSSETLNQSNRVTAIEILAESAEAAADLSLLVVADREKAELNLREAKGPKAPVAPKVPEAPKAPETPKAPAAPAAPKIPIAPKAPPIEKAPVVKAPNGEAAPKVERPKPKVEKVPKGNRTVTNQNRLARGTQVMMLERDYALATVVSEQADGTYTVKFQSGPHTGKSGGGWGRADLAVTSGCTQEFCVGDEVFNTEKSMAKVRVAAIESNNKLVLLFLDGPAAGKLGHNWPKEDLTTLKKCGKDFCVGDTAFLFGKDREPTRVLIIAIQQGSEKYGVFFIDGTLSGKRGNNWGYEDLAKPKGCGKKYCVGDTVINISKGNVRATIAGVQNNGKYVLFFESGSAQGRYGQNWEDVDLKRRNK